MTKDGSRTVKWIEMINSNDGTVGMMHSNDAQ